MATIAITPDQDVVELEVHIAAPPERVFQAITDPRQLLQWWGQRGMYQTTKWTSDLRPGGRWLSEGVSDKDGSPFQVGGEYLEVDPPRRLSYTWNPSWASHLKTVVQWSLEAANGGTRARVRHSGFAGDAAQATGHSQGWERVISWMQAFVEKGITVADRPAPTAPKP
jgi:uncharacterized protein YndB with AHSA1/START domain